MANWGGGWCGDVIGVEEVEEVTVLIGTGSWGGKGVCRVSHLDFPTGAGTSFVGCPC